VTSMLTPKKQKKLKEKTHSTRIKKVKERIYSTQIKKSKQVTSKLTPKNQKKVKRKNIFNKNQILTYNETQSRSMKKAKHVYKRKTARLFSVLVIQNLISQTCFWTEEKKSFFMWYLQQKC